MRVSQKGGDAGADGHSNQAAQLTALQEKKQQRCDSRHRHHEAVVEQEDRADSRCQTLASLEAQVDRPDLARYHCQDDEHHSPRPKVEVPCGQDSQGSLGCVAQESDGETRSSQRPADVGATGGPAAKCPDVFSGANAEQVVGGG